MKMKRFTSRKLSLGVCVAAATMIPLVPISAPADEATPTTSAAADCSSLPWMNTLKSASARAQALLDASTLDQKLRWLDEVAANNPQQTSLPIRDPNNPFVTTTITMPAQVPCTPTIQYTDGPGSVNADGGTTTFPAPVSLAASWSRSLAKLKGAAQADEAWHKQRNVLLAPGIASGRDPRNGRTSEYLSEDGLLAGLIAGAGTKGITSNPDEPVEAVIKHYVGNEQELDRQTSNDNVDQRTLREIYTLPFEIAIDRGNVGGVMCSYNQVNHKQACESDNTLKQILKTEIGFNGFVVTDFFAKHSPTVTPPDLKAGLDQELNAWLYWSPAIFKQAIADGIITEADIDAAAFRVVRAHIAAGLFDVARPSASAPVVSTDAHKAIARTVAESGSVLLKNEGGTLPLTRQAKKIAVIGPTASNAPTNGVSAGSVCSYSGFGGGVSCAPVAPLDSITSRAAQNGSSVTFDNGSDPNSAAAAAKAADVAIVFGYYREGEGNDRPNISLDGNGDALINAVAAANKNTIVVLQTGGPVVMPWLSQVKSVLETWYAGEQMGPATAALLFGDVNPTGKLPYTFPKSQADLPTAGSSHQYPGTFSDGSIVRPPGSTEIRQVDYSEGMEVGYRWYAAQHIAPLFPFGYGLSYAQYSYDKLQVTPSTADGTKELRIRFRLTNTSHRAGTETAQAYVELPSVANEPSKRLLAWKRVNLGAGVSKNVEINVSPGDLQDLHLLQYWKASTGRWTTPNGSFTITVGGSFDTALSDTVTIH